MNTPSHVIIGCYISIIHNSWSEDLDGPFRGLRYRIVDILTKYMHLESRFDGTVLPQLPNWQYRTSFGARLSWYPSL